MVIPADAHNSSVAIAEFQRLMFVQRDRSSDAEARVGLERPHSDRSVSIDFPAIPIVGIEREPEPRLEVVAEMTLDSGERILRLGVRAREFGVVRKEFVIFSEEPERLRKSRRPNDSSVATSRSRA